MVSRVDGCDGERSVGLNRSYRGLVDQNRGPWNSTLDRQRSEVRDGLQIENQFALLAFANPDSLIRNFLESAFGYSHHVIFEFEIRNPQLAALREPWLEDAVEENSGLVLTGHYHQRAQVLSRFEEGAQRGFGSGVDVEFVLGMIAAAGHDQLVRTGGDGGKVNPVRRHIEWSLPVEADLDGSIARIHLQLVGHAADHHRQQALGNDGPLEGGSRSVQVRESEGCFSLRTNNSQLVFPCSQFLQGPLPILKLHRRLIVERHFAVAGVRKQFQRGRRRLGWQRRRGWGRSRRAGSSYRGRDHGRRLVLSSE